MIDLYGGKITDIMPDSLKHSPEAKAVGYAISNMLKKVLDASKKSSVYAAIDMLDEGAIDLLAVEFRAKYYGDWLTLDEKKGIVKKTLLWHCRAGTPYTVQELTDFVFQDAKVEEWFQYGGGAYLFRIMVNIISQDMALEKFLKFLEAMYEVKNTRSHLEAVICTYRKGTEVAAVAAGGMGSSIKVKTRTASRVLSTSEDMAAPALFLNQNIKVKADNRIKGMDVYITGGDGGQARVFVGDGCVVRARQQDEGKEGDAIWGMF